MITDKIFLAAAIGFAGVAGIQTYRLSKAETRHAREVTDWVARENAALQDAARRESAARAEGQRRVVEQQEIANENATLVAMARADAASAADAGRRLRDQLAVARRTANRSCPAANPTPAGDRTTADASDDLLADVQRRLDEATDGIAQHADAAHLAGAACERIYDSLTP